MSINFFYISVGCNPPTIYRGKVDWLQNGFKIKLLTENVAFSGTVTEKQLEKTCKELSLMKEDYLEQCRIALCTKHTDTKFCYVVENDCFLIKKRLEMDSVPMNVQFLKISLEKISFAEAVIELLDAAIDWNYRQVEETKKLQVQNKILKMDNDNALKHLLKVEAEKISYEETLYKKFLNLLNSKKSATSPQVGLDSFHTQNNEFINIAREQSTADMDIFEVETDKDDDDFAEDPSSPNPPSPACSSHIIENKADLPVANKDVASNVQTLMDSMAFLDPTIPF